jgi:N-methylhydantoinase B
MNSLPNNLAPVAAVRDFDPVAVEVFSNRLLSIIESMASNMMRASFSPQIKERRDFSVGMFDARGRLVAQGSHIPVHLGSLMGSVEAVLARYPVADISDGDVYICNDPYAAGGTHLPDISIITPIFVDEKLIAFAANIGHHSDVGGATPGSISASARSIYEEGLRIPVLRVARNHRVDDDLIEMVALNSRLAEERGLDIRVQIATNEKGVEAAQQLIGRMGGASGFQEAIEDVLAYTSRRIQHRISALAPGRHSFTTWLDDDGSVGGPRVPITATVFKDGSTLVIDLEGTGPQSLGALNVAESALRATVYYCVKANLDPDLMANSGLAEAIVIRAPAGSIVNPTAPAACGARTITCQRLAGAVFGAFRGLISRNQLIASGNDTLPSVSFSGRRPGNGSPYLCLEAMGGGGGAKANLDGMDGIHVHITNSLNLPTEVMEIEFPLHVEQYGLAVDSGGAGFHRGGLGIVRQVRALQDDTILSVRSDSHIQGAAGAEGGGEGGLGHLLRNPDSETAEILPSKVARVVLAKGETIRIETPGGAGFGDPLTRPIQALAEDLRDGLVSKEAAQRVYGAERTAQALEVAREVIRS